MNHDGLPALRPAHSAEPIATSLAGWDPPSAYLRVRSGAEDGDRGVAHVVG